MKRSIKCILFLLVPCFVTSLKAQIVSESEQYEMQIRVRQAIEEFQYYLSNVMNAGLQQEIRKENVGNLLNLFIGDGGPYKYYDTDLDSWLHNSGVKIKIFISNRQRLESRRLKPYVYHCYNSPTGISDNNVYTKIEVKAADVVRVSEIQRVGDHYECIAYFTLNYFGFKEGKVAYSDRLVKKIKCYLNKNPMVKTPEGKNIISVKLGDIYVVSSKKNNNYKQ